MIVGNGVAGVDWGIVTKGKGNGNNSNQSRLCLGLTMRPGSSRSQCWQAAANTDLRRQAVSSVVSGHGWLELELEQTGGGLNAWVRQAVSVIKRGDLTLKRQHSPRFSPSSRPISTKYLPATSTNRHSYVAMSNFFRSSLHFYIRPK